MIESVKRLSKGRLPRALDVGAGSGRDAIILATAGWEVTALDQDKKGLARWSRLAARQGCADRCTAVHAKHNTTGDVVRAVCGQSYAAQTNAAEDVDETPAMSIAVFDLINVGRHLHRPTLAELADLLAPGGILLFHTFSRGCESQMDVFCFVFWVALRVLVASLISLLLKAIKFCFQTTPVHAHQHQQFPNFHSSVVPTWQAPPLSHIQPS
jgi:SAM-dependent methyltransferase